MSLEQNQSQQYREIPDKYVDPATSYQMKTYDYVVRPTPASGESIIITLPPVAEAKGRWYSIICRAIDGGSIVTVANKDDSEAWAGDIACNSTGDRILAFSDGLAWLCFFGNNNSPS